MDGMEKTVAADLSDEQIEKMTPQQVRLLVQENKRLKQELRIRDNDILSHDQVFDSIVSGTLHVILVMSVTSFTAEFVTSNVDTAFGISRADVMKNVRKIGHAFDDIGQYNGKEEIFIHQTNGARRQYLIYVIHLPYGRSDRVAVVLLCRSNAAKGDLEEMMLRQTQDVNRAAGYFLASLSHNFHVPISSIAGFVMLLMKNANNPARVMEYAHGIGLACQGILTTVDQILDMSRIETSHTALEVEEFGLGLMLEEINTIIASLARARDLQFFFLAKGIEHDIVLGDRQRLMEMLRLVLSNAVKYTPPGGRVDLKVTAVPDKTNENAALLFEVRDTGVGMEPDQVRKYFQEEIPENAEEVPGRGTGIWLTRRLVRMMGGTISAQSRPGEGTSIWIRLQLKMVNIGINDFWSRHGVHSMLVSDRNIQEAARIRNLMESAGVAAMGVSSGYGTIKMIEQAGTAQMEYDLVLLDDEMTDMDWREIVASIRKMTWIRKPCIILMTARTPGELGISDEEEIHLLQKPFYVSALHRLVEKVCDKHPGSGRQHEEDIGTSMNGLRFLAAEDNSINAELLKELLEMSGSRCEIAGNGRAALAMFSNSKPGTYDAILLDVQMPVMDGYAAAAAIRALEREDAKSVPIIAMTSNSFEEDVNRIYEAGFNTHIKKPFNIRSLQSHLRRVHRLGNGERPEKG